MSQENIILLRLIIIDCLCSCDGVHYKIERVIHANFCPLLAFTILLISLLCQEENMLRQDRDLTAFSMWVSGSVRHPPPYISPSSSYGTLPLFFFFLFHYFILLLPLISLLHNACVLLAICLIAGFRNVSRMPSCTTHDNPDTCSSLFDKIFQQKLSDLLRLSPIRLQSQNIQNN
jgi:hypothetical protein